MKRIIILILLAITVIPTVAEGPHSTQVFAATATSSATTTPSATVTPSQAQDLQEKIKTLVRENLSATESAVRERINQRTLVGYVGTIKSMNSDHLTLSTKEETLFQVTTDENTSIIKKGSEIKFSSLAISDKVIVIGTLLKDEILLGKRISVIPEEVDPMTSDTIVAKVSSVDVKKKIIGLTVNNTEVLYTLTKKSTIKIAEISEGDTLFGITKKYDGNDYLSRAKVIVQ